VEVFKKVSHNPLLWSISFDNLKSKVKFKFRVGAWGL